MNLDMTQNVQFMKEIIDKLVFIKLKTSAMWKTNCQENELSCRTGKKYLQKA